MRLRGKSIHYRRILAAVPGRRTTGQCDDVVARTQAHSVGLIRVEVQFQPIVGRHAHEDVAKG